MKIIMNINIDEYQKYGNWNMVRNYLIYRLAWNGQLWYHQRISLSMILMILNAHTCLSSLKYKLKLISTVEVCRCSSFTTTVTNVFGTKGNGLGLVCRGVNYQNKVISSSSNLLRGGHVHDFHKYKSELRTRKWVVSN